ncbi:hypothetical protein IB276_18480 [Ensifer sp. ENS04]|uniref:hypothetical protein n=1 Tax=Ensifer sp. ENS04 TaxID=2769281 RepID=UPI001786A8F3|nr:hypothetical protein [Ensifer sp. ENS04]MBD9541444.1 hypothetical protein [Ensifer sp. ENS04]
MTPVPSAGTQVEKWTWLLIVFCAPLFVTFLASWIFNETIETQLISYDFFADAPRNVKVLEGKIPASLILALYRFGFSLCATFVLAVFLAVYATHLILSKSAVTWTIKALYLAILAAILCIAMLRFAGYQVTAGHLPAEIARKLIDNTLGKLPQCGDPHTACPFLRDAIGNTGSSLKDVVIPIFWIVAIAGLSYICAVASITWGTEDAATKKQHLENVTVLTALTFLLTVVAVQLLFRPGAEMIAAAYSPVAPDAKPLATLVAYEQLSSAMTLYWATIFSLALCSSYFPASLYLNAAYGSQISFSGVWSFAKTAITMLAPIMATGAVGIADGLLGTFGK